MTRKVTDFWGGYSNGAVSNPHKKLASAIIMMAIHDKRRYRVDVVSFFQSDYFETLADLALIDPDVVREKLHIPELPVTFTPRGKFTRQRTKLPPNDAGP